MAISKQDFDKLHEKVDKHGEILARIESKIESAMQERSAGLSFIGIVSAIILGIFNLVK